MIAVAFDIETEGHQTNKGYPSLLLLLLRAAGSTYDVTLYKKDFGLKVNKTKKRLRIFTHQSYQHGVQRFN